MAEAITLLVFVFMLLGCVAADISVVFALTGGLVCFCIYTLYYQYTVFELWVMIWKGLKDSKTILAVFILIGFLTAIWRAAGTIPCIVYYSASSMIPRYYLVLTFFLCCGMSALTGTSFGTASTMGVICASVGTAMDIPTVLTGGAVMSGIYFGEQCSPMSSSALLVCKLTETNIFNNIIAVLKEILVPLGITTVLYLYLGRNWGDIPTYIEHTEIFVTSFHLDFITLLPALIIILFSFGKIRVEYTMIASIMTAAVISIVYQGLGIGEVLNIMIWGYQADNTALAVLMDGGGLTSMLELGGIVAISSAYFGIFSSTKLLLHLKQWVWNLGLRSNAFFATIVVSVITCGISCNQTLASMLTCEMTKKLVPQKETLAVNLEMSVIVIAGLIPWSIACVFPLAVVGAPKESLFYACYLYLVPLWMLLKGWACSLKYKFKDRKNKTRA